MSSISSFPPRILSRSVSSPELKDFLKADSRKSHLWEWIRETPNPFGGKLILFRLQDQFDMEAAYKKWEEAPDALKPEWLNVFNERKRADDQITAQIFPAVEPYLPCELEKLREPPFPALGFSVSREDEGLFVTFPDKKALEANWKELMRAEARPLPPLIIDAMKEGTASAHRFIRSNLSFSGALSESHELLHDLFVHWVSILEQLFYRPSERFEMDMHFVWLYQILILAQDRIDAQSGPIQLDMKRKWEIAQELVSAYIDLATAKTDEMSREGTAGFDKMALHAHKTKWLQYFKERFPDEVLTESSLEEIWRFIFEWAQEEEKERNRNSPPKSLYELGSWLFIPAGQEIDDPCGSHELYRLEKIFLPIKGLTYSLKGPKAGFEMCFLSRDMARLTKIEHLEERPQLIDFICHSAVHYGASAVYLSIPENWPLYFELGFRLPKRFTLYNDLFLIDYAIAMGWMNREQVELLGKLHTLCREVNSHSKDMSIGFFPLEEERALQAQSLSGETLHFHQAQEICAAARYLAHQFVLDPSFIMTWKQCTGDVSAELLGRQRLEGDYEDLCSRMTALKEHYLPDEQVDMQERKFSKDQLSCKIL